MSKNQRFKCKYVNMKCEPFQKRIIYDSETEKLYVIFTNGAAYEYYNVPASVHERFMESNSKGRFVNNVLTCLYNYRPIYGNR